jgi:hypothetical protein
VNEATDIRRAARDGRDLIRELQQQRAKAVTFRQAFEAYYANREKTLSNSKHRQQWSSTIETYVYPKIGDLPVSDVTHADVLGILEPIWFDNAETGACCSAWCSRRRSCLASAKERRPALASCRR